MQFGDTVTLVNRTSKSVLGVQWDGVHYHFPPGEHPNIPIQIAIAALKQHPLMGSEDPLGDPGIFRSLFGIRGASDPFGDITPLEQTDADERIDRSKVMGVGGDKKQVRKINAGGPTHFDARMGTETVNLQDDAVTRR